MVAWSTHIDIDWSYPYRHIWMLNLCKMPTSRADYENIIRISVLDSSEQKFWIKIAIFRRYFELEENLPIDFYTSLLLQKFFPLDDLYPKVRFFKGRRQIIGVRHKIGPHFEPRKKLKVVLHHQIIGKNPHIFVSAHTFRAT